MVLDWPSTTSQGAFGKGKTAHSEQPKEGQTHWFPDVLSGFFLFSKRLCSRVSQGAKKSLCDGTAGCGFLGMREIELAIHQRQMRWSHLIEGRQGWGLCHLLTYCPCLYYQTLLFYAGPHLAVGVCRSEWMECTTPVSLTCDLMVLLLRCSSVPLVLLGYRIHISPALLGKKMA